MMILNPTFLHNEILNRVSGYYWNLPSFQIKKEFSNTVIKTFNLKHILEIP